VASLGDGGACHLPSERSESVTRTFQYDSSTSTPHGDPFYRPTSVETRITLGSGANATQTFQTQHRYDRWYGRMKQRVHPGGVGVYFAYSARGDLVEEGLSADFVAYGSSDNAYLRKVQAVDAFGQPTEVRQGRDAQRWLARRDGRTGWMLEVCAQTGSAACDQLATNPQVRSAKLMDLGYRYDAYGNVIEQRTLAVGPYGTPGSNPHAAPIVDTYAYDTLHRVTANTVVGAPGANNAPTTRTTNFRYDSVGNLTRKTDLSVDADTGYTYTGSYRLNRINAPANATLDFGYDANGNVTARTPTGILTGAPRRLAIDYDVDNLPLRISTEPTGVGTQGHYFRYGPDGARYVEETRTNSQTAFVRLTVDGVYERDLVQPTGALVERWHLSEGVMLVRNSSSSEPQSGVHFIGRDRLGSSTVVTRLTAAGTAVPVNDANGRADHRSYDLYGRPRDAWADPGQKIDSATTRGFTEHEHLDLAGLIHMNGRVFDPLVGRFYGVDPIIQFPTNSQSLNPYSYILNNPLSGTDPTGYAAETPWDAAHVVYDFGKILVGYVIGDDDLVNEGAVDLACDLTAMAIPVVPAGASKLGRIAAKNADRGAASRRPPTDRSLSRDRGNGAADSQGVADRTSREGANIGKQSDATKGVRRTDNGIRDRHEEGKAFESRAGDALDKTGYTDARNQLRVRTDSGKLRVIDRNATGPDGKKINVEMKGSDKARYPRHQREADREIAERGGTIASSGPDHGQRLPPTPTKVVRPCNIREDGTCQ
jgi:RHS repeat-associated protein